MNAIGIALAAVLGVLGVRWFLQQRPKQRERVQFKALMLECDGDRELVERLICAEMERDESIDFAGAARRARNKLKRDRR